VEKKKKGATCLLACEERMGYSRMQARNGKESECFYNDSEVEDAPGYVEDATQRCDNQASHSRASLHPCIPASLHPCISPRPQLPLSLIDPPLSSNLDSDYHNSRNMYITIVCQMHQQANITYVLIEFTNRASTFKLSLGIQAG
jgi:hypothetical protein